LPAYLDCLGARTAFFLGGSQNNFPHLASIPFLNDFNSHRFSPFLKSIRTFLKTFFFKKDRITSP